MVKLAYTGGTEDTFYRMVQAAMPKEEGACGKPTVRSDGSIEYPRGNPPEITGYRRIGDRLFKPCWPSCRWRALVVTHPNNLLQITGSCQHPISAQYLKQVTPENCQVCEHRIPCPHLVRS